jgi:uncharacterized protein YjdB
MRKSFTAFMMVLFAVMLSSLTALGQATYTWNVSNGAWTTSGSWNPSRATSLTDDILVFDGGTVPSPWVTSVPTETIGKLVVQNNAYVRL